MNKQKEQAMKLAAIRTVVMTEGVDVSKPIVYRWQLEKPNQGLDLTKMLDMGRKEDVNFINDTLSPYIKKIVAAGKAGDTESEHKIMRLIFKYKPYLVFTVQQCREWFERNDEFYKRLSQGEEVANG